jgi:hypothetical protein
MLLSKYYIKSMKKLYILLALIFTFGILSPATAFARTIDFSGYNWQVKSGGPRGPGPNLWDDSSDFVFVDSRGRLHLNIKEKNNNWYSSEVYINRSLGYGIYEFVVDKNSRVDEIDPNIVFGMFLYENDEREIDFEWSRWGDSSYDNFSTTVQPWSESGNVLTADINLDSRYDVMHRLDWQADRIIFSVLQNNRTIYSRVYTGDRNFVPGREIVDINFWLMNGWAPLDNQDREVIIKSFDFYSLNNNPGPLLVPKIKPITLPVPPAQEAPELGPFELPDFAPFSFEISEPFSLPDFY